MPILKLSNQMIQIIQASSIINETGFIPKYGIDDAIDEIIGAWKRGKSRKRKFVHGTKMKALGLGE